MRITVLTSLAAAALAACGGGPSATPDATAPSADATVDAPAVDAMPAQLACVSYPATWLPDPDTKATAIADLATFAPGANLTWNDDSGTFSSIFQMNVDLPACTDGADVNATVLALVQAHQDLFQIDLAEWKVPDPFDCRFVTTDFATQTLGRTTLGGQPVAKDIFTYTVKRNAAGTVQLTSVIATYVPPAPADVIAAMNDCTQLADASAKEIVIATPLTAREYDNCAPTGAITYHLAADDTVEVAPGAVWTWDPQVARVVLSATRTVTVKVAPAHFTHELLQSGARCPADDPDHMDSTVGWQIQLDARTGAVIYIQPGLDCTVC